MLTTQHHASTQMLLTLKLDKKHNHRAKVGSCSIAEQTAIQGADHAPARECQSAPVRVEFAKHIQKRAPAGSEQPREQPPVGARNKRIDWARVAAVNRRRADVEIPKQNDAAPSRAQRLNSMEQALAQDMQAI